MIQMNQRTIDLQISYEFWDILAWVNIIFLGTKVKVWEELMQVKMNIMSCVTLKELTTHYLKKE